MESYGDIVPEIDVVIVGGGLSGLVTAYKILSKEPTLKLIIMEEGQEIGGHISTVEKYELGAKLIYTDHEHIVNLCKNLNVKLNTNPPSGIGLNRCWQLDYGIFSGLAKFELSQFIEEMDYISKKYVPGYIGLLTGGQQWGISMENYLCKKLFFKQSRELIRFLVRAICGVEPENISLTEYLMICNGCGGVSGQLNNLTNIQGENMVCEDGLKQLCHILEDLIGHFYILLNTKLITVEHYKNCICLTTNKHSKLRCAVLVLAIPWQNTQRLTFTPLIPAELVIPNFENRPMVTNFIAEYSEPFWKNLGFSGSILLHNPHMVCWEIDTNTLTGSIYHEEFYEEILQPITLDKLAALYGPEMKTPNKWIQNTYEQPILLNLSPTTPWNRIVWASSNASTRYRGFLNGGVQAGYRAAVLTLLQLRPQSISWGDVDEIQSAAAVKLRFSTLHEYKLSLNLYNITFYTVLLCTCFIGYRSLKCHLLKC